MRNVFKFKKSTVVKRDSTNLIELNLLLISKLKYEITRLDYHDVITTIMAKFIRIRPL